MLKKVLFLEKSESVLCYEKIKCMQESRLVEVFKTLTRSELTQFQKFVNSPYMSNSPKNIALFRLLRADLRAYETENDKKNYHLSSERAYTKVYREKWTGIKNQRDKLMQIRKQLLEHIEYFLVLEYVKKQEKEGKEAVFFNKTIVLAVVYENKKLIKYALQHLEKGLKLLEQQKVIDNDYFQAKAKINEYLLRLTMPSETKDSKALQKYAAEMNKNMDYDYYFKKLVFYCSSATRRHLLKGVDTVCSNKIREVFNFIEKNDLLDIPTFAGYYYYAQTLFFDKDKEKKLAAFKGLKNVLLTKGDYLSDFDLRQFCNSVINFYTLQIRMGESKHFADMLELYRWAIPANVLEVGGFLDHNHYRKCLSAACVLKEFDCAAKFSKLHTKKLRLDFQDSYYVYGQATICFYKKEYKKAIQEMNQLQPAKDDDYLKLFARLLIAKIGYEQPNVYKYLTNFRVTGSDTTFENYLQNVQRWVREHAKLLGENYEYYKSLIDFLLRLFKIKINYTYKAKRSQQQLKKVIKDINTCPHMICEKNWLLTKINELQ